MAKKDLNKKSEKDLLKIVSEGKQKIQEAVFSAGGDTTKDTSNRKKIRKDIARALTALNNKNNK